MSLPKQLPPLYAIALGLAVFFFLSWAANGFGMLMSADLAARHVLLKGMLIAFTLAVVTWHPSRLSLLGMRVPQGRSWIVLAIGGGLAGSITTFLLLAFEADGVPLLRNLSLPEIVITIWIFSSVSEEFYCRGLIQPWIDDNSDRIWTHPATLASATIFGGMHLSLLFSDADPATVVIIVSATTLLGYLCAVARRTSDSLWPPILTHIYFNVGGFLGSVVAILLFGRQIVSN